MKLLKAFGIYTFSTFLKSLIPFLLLPIITKYLSPEDFGIANFYQVLLRLISGIIMLGVPACCTIYYFKHDRKEYPSLVLNSLISPIALTIVLLIVSALFIKQLTPIFELNYLWVLFIAPIALLYLIPDITYTTLRNQEKPILFSTFNLSQILLHFGITTILIVIFDFNWLGILLGVLLSLIIINLSSLRYLISNNLLGGEINRQKIKYAVYIGAPLILHRIGGILINKSIS